MSLSSPDQWEQAHLVQQPENVFVLWTIWTGFCTSVDEFRQNYGDSLDWSNLLINLEGSGWVEHKDRLTLTPAGSKIVTRLTQTMPSSKSFALLLRRYRDTRKLMREELDRKAGLDGGTTESLETEEALYLSANTFERLVQGLGLSEEEHAALEMAAYVEPFLPHRESSSSDSKAAALRYYEQILAISLENGDETGEVEALNELFILAVQLGRQELATQYGEAMLALTLSASDRAAEAKVLRMIAISLRDSGHHTESWRYYEQALAIVRELGDRQAEGDILYGLGFLAHDQGREEEALDYYIRALEIMREVDNETGQVATLHNIGSIKARPGNKDEAIQYLQQALLLAQKIGDRASEGKALNNLANIAVSQGRAQDAIDMYGQALSIAKAEGNQMDVGTFLFNLGVLRHMMRQRELAYDYLQLSLGVFQKIGADDHIWMVRKALQNLRKARQM